MKYTVILTFITIKLLIIIGIILLLFGLEAGAILIIIGLTSVLLIISLFSGKLATISFLICTVSLTMALIFEHHKSFALTCGLIGIISLIVMVVGITVNLIKSEKEKKKQLSDKQSIEADVVENIKQAEG